MRIAKAIGDLIALERHPRGLWKTLRYLATGATVVEILLALIILDLIPADAIGNATAISAIGKAAAWLAAQANPAAILAYLVLTRHGGQKLMTLLEIAIRPLLKAQHQAGEEVGLKRGRAEGEEAGLKRGRAETAQTYQEWIQRLRDAGVDLDDIPPPPPPSGE